MRPGLRSGSHGGSPSRETWNRFPAKPLRALLLAAFAFTFAAPPARAACPPVDHAHRQWSALLERWVSAGLVDYAGWRRDGEAELGAYLRMLSQACATDYERWSRPQRIAFWINAYNAFTVRLILDHYPVVSIRAIGWLPLAAFRQRFIPMPDIKGGDISLNDIEHDTLRASFQEPRIHFALVCASRSCPALRGEAYRAADLDRQLDEQAREFLNDATRNRVDAAGKVLYLSAIFDWFASDFEAAAGSVPAYVARYVDLGGADASAFRVEHLTYDWALNERGKDRP